MPHRDIHSARNNPDLAEICAALRQALDWYLNDPAGKQLSGEDDTWISLEVNGAGYAAQFDREAAYVYAEDEDRIHTDTVMAVMPLACPPAPTINPAAVELLPHGPGNQV